MARHTKNRRTKTRADVRHNEHSGVAIRLPDMTEADVLEALEQIETPFLLVLDGVQDPHNLGACLRSAEAAGVDFVIAPAKHTCGITETVRMVSCGGADSVPYIRVPNLNRFLEKLIELEITLVGTGDEESSLLYDVDMTGRLAVVAGTEASGIRRKTAEKCDHLVRIPMLGETVDCLNLSVAAGVCLFEAVRQKAVAREFNLS